MTTQKPFPVFLCNDPWHWFRDGSKLWELRVLKRQYSEKSIVEGRQVVLCRGYNTPDRLYGAIKQVKLFNDLDTALTILGHMVIPEHVAGDLVAQRRLMIKMFDCQPDDRFIAFRPANLIGKDLKTGKEFIVQPEINQMEGIIQ
jgi:hypothetical protein